MNIPNAITLLRILLIPIFVVLFYIPFKWCDVGAAIIFIIAAISDWLDGYLARTLNQASKFGAFLDPVADKLVVAVALVLLVSEPQLKYISLPAVIIVCREIIISALREWMAEIGKRASIAVSYVAKVKTCVQMLALIILIVTRHDSFNGFLLLGYILLYSAAILTMYSMIMYLKTAWPDLDFILFTSEKNKGA